MGMCLIYLLLNKINHKVYVGQTWKTFEKRFNNGKGYVNCVALNNAIQKYGVNNFEYKLLTVCATQTIADFWEKYFIKKYNSQDFLVGYNLKEGGSNGKLSEDTKEKISLSLKGVNTWTKGTFQSKETIEKRSIAMIGKNVGNTLSDLTKDKMSQSKIDKPSPNKGNKLSLETKSKMSNSQKGNTNKLGKKVSPEGKEKMMASGQKGKTWKLINGKRVWLNKKEK